MSSLFHTTLVSRIFLYIYVVLEKANIIMRRLTNIFVRFAHSWRPQMNAFQQQQITCVRTAYNIHEEMKNTTALPS